MEKSSAAPTGTLIPVPPSLLTSFAVGAVLGGALALLFLSRTPTSSKPRSYCETAKCVHRQPKVPFVVLHDPEWREIHCAVEKYEEEVAAILNGLSRSLEVAQSSEWDIFGDNPPEYLLSDQLQRRIDRLASLLEQDKTLFEKHLFRPFFPVTKVLPAGQRPHHAEQEVPWWTRRPPPSSQPPRRATVVSKESASYDSVTQVLAHITRDWTVLGESLRQRTYDWCRAQLADVLSRGDTILAPGAGMGRLAFDLALDGFSVEANDCSILMASAAHAVLQQGMKGAFHPFLTDYFTNEVDSEWRYERVDFPDVSIYEMKGSLSYTVGDFIEVYAADHTEGRYDGIVTCFFLDTATNVYEYLWTMQHVLKEGGVWVNLGPLQWHRNALLHPSADELKELVEAMGFRITYWNIDLEAMDYRYEESTVVRSTKHEAFKPIRMVAVRGEVTKRSFLPNIFQRQYSQKKRPEQSTPNIPSHVVIEEL